MVLLSSRVFSNTTSRAKEVFLKKHWCSLAAMTAVILLLFMAAVPFVDAATYYIDYQAGSDGNNGTSKTTPWKRCPGMVGFVGAYAHQAGDKFVFKGGVTWPSAALPLTIAYSGTSASCDIVSATNTCDKYTVDKAWYVDGSWDYPVFDGEDRGNYAAGLILSRGKSNFIVDNLKIIKAGNVSDGSGTGLFLDGGSNKQVKNCWIESNAINAYADSCAGGGSRTYFNHNTVKKSGRITVSCGDNTYDDYQFYNNAFLGLTGYDPRTFHTDGLMIQSDGVGRHKFTNIRIFNNKWLGDWTLGGTGFFYTSSATGKYGLQHVYIYNNLIAPSNTTGGMAQVLRFGATNCPGTDDVRIYNNTIDVRSTAVTDRPSICIAFFYTNSNIDIQNNILVGCGRGLTLDSSTTGTVTIEHNLYYDITNQWLVDSSAPYKSCNTITGGAYPCSPYYENAAPAGQLADPKFVGSSDWRLQTGSPAVNAGADLSRYFVTDVEGQSRRSGTWTLGAYEGSSGLGIAAPKNLRIGVQ
jgi:hypothetical protein